MDTDYVNELLDDVSQLSDESKRVGDKSSLKNFTMRKVRNQRSISFKEKDKEKEKKNALPNALTPAEKLDL